MMDRSRASSSFLALAFLSTCALSACTSQDDTKEPVAKVSSALTALQAGDVAVTCMFTTGDQLQIVPLVALDVGSDVKYTDREANAAGQFNTGENVDVVYPITSPGDASTVIPAGTVLPFGPAPLQGFPGGLGDGTEQVFLYQGAIAPSDGGAPNYQLLWGMQISPGGIWVATRDDGNNLSELPTVLTGFNVVLASGTSTNYAYDSNKGTTGTKAQLQAKIANPANWLQGTVAAPVTCPVAFTVLPDEVDSGAGTDSSTGAGGAGASDAGAGGATGTTDSGAGGSTDSGTGPDTAAVDSGAGGTAGADGGTTDTGAGGAGGSDAGAGGATGAGGSAADAGADAKTDTGGTDAKADTGTATDAKVDTGTTGGTDAKVDTGTKADTGVDSGTTSKGSSGCSCSTSSNGQNVSASVTLLALAGIVMTTRRRRRR